MEKLKIHPKNQEESAALEAVMKVLKIDFETEEGQYNPKFVKDILQAQEGIKNDKGIKVIAEDLLK